MSSSLVELARWPTLDASRIVVCGPRAWTQPFYVRAALLGIRQRYGNRLVIVNGLARGVDIMAHEIAQELGFQVEGFEANWKLHGRGAGIVRNTTMLNTEPELVVAIGWGTGTQDTVNQAIKRGIPVVWRHGRVIPGAA